MIAMILVYAYIVGACIIYYGLETDSIRFRENMEQLGGKVGLVMLITLPWIALFSVM